MIKQLINKVSDRILEESKYSKDRSDKYGEVFTPPELIREMLDKIPQEMWLDKSKTFLDPCAGKGNFPIEVIKKLFVTLEGKIPNEEERLKHIVENQIYMIELQPESIEFLKTIFTFGKDYKVNLQEGDALEIMKINE